MAIRWNDIKAQRAVRERSLAATPEPVAEPTPINESVSNIDVGGVEYIPSWRIVGISPTTANPVTGIVAELEPVERFPARPRGATFPVRYQNLDAGGLDSQFVTNNGLTAFTAQDNTWVEYYPGLSSGTEVGKVSPFQVGTATQFVISQPSLSGTAYKLNSYLLGQDQSAAGTDWNGTITNINYSTNTITVVPDYISRTILEADPTQAWNISIITAASEPEPIP